MNTEYYIGLMSGTSLDGIDAGLYDFSAKKPKVIHFYYQPYPPALKKQIQAISQEGAQISLLEYGQLDTYLGELYAEACLELLAQANIDAKDIKAIGSHGQTLYHAPNVSYPFSLQIGNPNSISQKTGITTVADFRRQDIAAGGQGAPLVPAFHQTFFHHPEKNHLILNIGGIANLSYLPKDSKQKILGFDTGTGNTLMNAWIFQHKNQAYDNQGEWAAAGKLQPRLLKHLKDDPYFKKAPPKSTGTEYFSMQWLTDKLSTLADSYSPVDIQNTLCQFTADTISDAIYQETPEAETVFICGGGIHNQYLIKLLKKQLSMPVLSTEVLGIHPDQVEAMAFAWLAKQTYQGKVGNLPDATGANKSVILGAIYPSSPQ